MELLKEMITKRYKHDKSCLIEVTKHFFYDTEEEKMKHKATMELKGFTDNGIVKKNISSVFSSEIVWFGSYYRCYIEKPQKYRRMIFEEFKSIKDGDEFYVITDGDYTKVRALEDSYYNSDADESVWEVEASDWACYCWDSVYVLVEED